MDTLTVVDTASLRPTAEGPTFYFSPPDGPAAPVVTDDKAQPSEPSARYAAGGGTRPHLDYPSLSDELTLAHLVALHGDRACDWMTEDDKVHASVHTLKQAILADDVQLVPACPEVAEDDDSPDAARRREDADNARQVNASDIRSVSRLRGGLIEWLYSMLDATVYASMLAEAVWEKMPDGPDAGHWMLEALPIVPRKNWKLGIDKFGDVAGYFVVTPDNGEVFLEKRKYARLSWMPRQGDPRGTRILDCVFRPVNFKRKLYPQFFDYVDKYGSPSLVGKTPPKAVARPAKNPDGSLIPGRTVEPTVILATALEDFRSNSILAVTSGTEVDKIEVTGDGQVHLGAFDLCDRAVVHGLLQSTRTTMEAEHGSRADAQQGQDVTSLLVRIGKHFVATMVREEVLVPLNQARYGRDWAERYTSRVQLGMVSRADQAALLNAIANLVIARAIAAQDVPRILRWVGLPVESAVKVQALVDDPGRPNGAGSNVPAPPSNDPKPARQPAP